MNENEAKELFELREEWQRLFDETMPWGNWRTRHPVAEEMREEPQSGRIRETCPGSAKGWEGLLGVGEAVMKHATTFDTFEFTDIAARERLQGITSSFNCA